MQHLAEEINIDDKSRAAWYQKCLPSLRKCLSSGQAGLPTIEEIFAMLKEENVPEAVIAHSIKVAETAVKIAGWLQEAGISLSVSVLAAAGLLHDVAKGHKDHAAAGAEFVTKQGYKALAPMIAAHMDFDFNEQAAVEETAVLYIADKLVAGTCLVNLESRFESALERYSEVPEVMRRFSSALAIRTKILKVVNIQQAAAEDKELWDALAAKNTKWI